MAEVPTEEGEKVGALGSALPLWSVYRPLIGIPTFDRYTDHFQLVGIFNIGVKMPQFRSKWPQKKGVK